MKMIHVLGPALASILFSPMAVGQPASGPDPSWRIHSMERPVPPLVQPGTPSTQEHPGKPPSDAIVLFSGEEDISNWRSMDGSPAKWAVKDGHLESVKGSGYIRTYRNFGDCQLHVEWAAPVPPAGASQGRGNSGVFLMGQYEVQVLDSYENRTYADGQAGAVYAQYPPLVNAARPPGEWQTFDIVFYAPRFSAAGEVVEPARMTVFHNGVLVQSNVALTGPTGWLNRARYRPHPDKLPISLQDHGNPVRYRNIWVRELSQPDEVQFTLAPEVLDRYTGTYRVNQDFFVTISCDDAQLYGEIRDMERRPLFASSETTFFLESVALEIEFHPSASGKAERLTFKVAGDRLPGRRVQSAQ